MVANVNGLEAAHHRWQRRILGIIWRDKIRNEEMRHRTRLETHTEKDCTAAAGTYAQ